MNLKKRYTHIFFDLDNTLWDFNANACSAMKSAFEGYEQQLEQIGFRLFFHEYSLNNTRLWKEYRLGRILKKDLVRLRFQQTFDALQIHNIDPEEMNERYLNEMPRQTRLTDGARSTLEALRKKGCSLYVITNGFTEVQSRKMESAGILHFFSKIFTSDDVKKPKPSELIFRYALQSANARKSSSLMVGDDFEADILGALHFGMDAAHLRCSEDLYQSPELKYHNQRFYRLDMLSDLRNIVF